ncbi:MAG: hypothetical protein EOP38_26170, partial [Rubrivivax sp.]
MEATLGITAPSRNRGGRRVFVGVELRGKAWGRGDTGKRNAAVIISRQSLFRRDRFLAFGGLYVLQIVAHDVTQRGHIKVIQLDGQAESGDRATLFHGNKEISMFEFARFLRCIPLTLISLLGFPVQAQSNLSAEVWQQIMTRLPQPKSIPAVWPRTCLATSKEHRETRPFTYSSPAVEARYRARSRDFTLALATWGGKYFQMPLDAKSDLCRDFPFVVAQLQQAAGDEPTGIFGERDAERLEKAIDFSVKIEASKVYAFGFQLGEVLD